MKITDKDPGKHNNISYPMEIGSQKFEPIAIEKQKDIMVNVAKLHAEQEYTRIMEQVTVLQKQAEQLQRRLHITEMVHSAHYEFQIFHGKIYHLVNETSKNRMILTKLGPNDWSCGPPLDYDYVAKVKWLGDYSWEEILENDK